MIKKFQGRAGTREQFNPGGVPNPNQLASTLCDLPLARKTASLFE